MFKKTNHILLIFVLVGLIFCAGCFDYQETLVINSDGSGTIQMKYAVDKVYLDQMKMMYEQMAQQMPEMKVPDDPSEMMFKKSDIEKALAEENSTVKLLHYEKTQNENSQIWDMKFSFTDINNLDALSDALTPEDQYEYDIGTEDIPEEEIKLITKQPDGTLLFYRPLNEYNSNEDMEDDMYGGYEEEYDDNYNEGEEDSSENLGELGQQIEEGLGELTDQLSAMTEGMEDKMLVFKVTFPGKIVESNATSVDGNTATWKYKLSELNKDVPAQEAVIKP